MAIKAFTQVDRTTGRRRPEEREKERGSDLARPSFGWGRDTTGRAGGMRYGDTAMSVVPRRNTATGITARTPPPPPATPPPPDTPGSTWSPWRSQEVLGASETGMTQDIGGENPGGRPILNEDLGGPMSGLMAQLGYTPGGLISLYDQPNVLAADILRELFGIENPGMTQMIGDAFWPALYAYVSLNPNFGAHEDDAVFNYIGNYVRQMNTPGGSMPDFGTLLASLLAGLADETTDLGRIFAQMEPSQQMEIIAQYGRAAGYGMNPLIQRLLPEYFDSFAQDYFGEVAKGRSPASSYAAYMADQRVPGLGR